MSVCVFNAFASAPEKYFSLWKVFASNPEKCWIDHTPIAVCWLQIWKRLSTIEIKCVFRSRIVFYLQKLVCFKSSIMFHTLMCICFRSSTMSHPLKHVLKKKVTDFISSPVFRLWMYAGFSFSRMLQILKNFCFTSSKYFTHWNVFVFNPAQCVPLWDAFASDSV